MERTFAHIASLAPTVFLKDGYHTPILFLQRIEGGTWGAIHLSYDNAEAKARQLRALGLAFKAKPAEAYVFVAEAWAVTVKAALDDILGMPPPHAHPDRVELLTVYGADRHGNRKRKAWRIQRDPLGLQEEPMDGVVSEAAMDEILLHIPTSTSSLRYGDKGLQIDERKEEQR